MTDYADFSKIDFEPSLAMAESLFDELAARTRGKAGIVREPYGEGEQIAHDMVQDLARQWNLETRIDAFGNLYITVPGKDRDRPAWFVGSHLDSVPEGGNYDGGAGFVAGFVAAHALVTNGVQLACDLTVIAIRAEEASSWFAGRHKSHFGSRAMFGQLSREEMNEAVLRSDGRSLFQVVKAAGFDPEKADKDVLLQDPEKVAGFIELHIEQGPVLIEADLSVAVITGIRGNLRARNCKAVGEHAHSGAVPREYRHDAVFAVAEFAYRLETQWAKWLEDGRDCVCTIGILTTDHAEHSISKIPGLAEFVIDFRSIEPAMLSEGHEFITALAAEISAKRGVTLDLGPFTSNPPEPLSMPMLEEMERVSSNIGVQTLRMASGGGHDAVSFSQAGIPTTMLFVRNQNGSHNPHEAMEMVDFAQGAKLILAYLMAQQ